MMIRMSAVEDGIDEGFSNVLQLWMSAPLVGCNVDEGDGRAHPSTIEMVDAIVDSVTDFAPGVRVEVDVRYATHSALTSALMAPVRPAILHFIGYSSSPSAGIAVEDDH